MEQTIFNYAETFANSSPFLSYVFLFFNAVMQTLFPPYPGDTIIIFEGYLLTLNIFNDFLIVFITLLGTVSSNIFLFLLCYKYGYKIFNIPVVAKFFSEEKIKELKKVFDKYGPPLIFFNRFVPSLGVITVISAGVLKVSKFKSILCIVLSSSLHNMCLLTLGFLVGNNIPLIKSIVFRFNKVFITLALILTIIIMLIYFYKKSKNNIKVNDLAFRGSDASEKTLENENKK